MKWQNTVIHAITEVGTSCNGRLREGHVFEFVCGSEWLGRLPGGKVQGSSVSARFIPRQ